MDALIQKYKFNNEQVEDIKNVIAESIKILIPDIGKEIKSIIMDNFKQQMMSDKELLDDVNKIKKDALKYVQKNTELASYGNTIS